MKHKNEGIVIVARSVDGDDNWSRHERNERLVWERLNDKTYPMTDPSEDQVQEINYLLISKYGENIDQTHWVEMVGEKYFEEFKCPYY